MFDDGIISNYPPSLAGRPAYPIFVSKVDQDGNEVAGIRLPPVAAPVATTTGWALRRAGFSENEGCESDGQHIPFMTTKEERLAVGDPRRSLEERYKDHDGYVKAVKKAAEKLGKLAGSFFPPTCRRISTKPRTAPCFGSGRAARLPGRPRRRRMPDPSRDRALSAARIGKEEATMDDERKPRPDRPDAGPLLHVRLAEHLEQLRRESTWRTRGRNAITLSQEPGLRLVLMLLSKGTKIPAHHASGP